MAHVRYTYKQYSDPKATMISKERERAKTFSIIPGTSMFLFLLGIVGIWRDFLTGVLLILGAVILFYLYSLYIKRYDERTAEMIRDVYDKKRRENLSAQQRLEEKYTPLVQQRIKDRYFDEYLSDPEKTRQKVLEEILAEQKVKK